jgi:hypothetical protein
VAERLGPGDDPCHVLSHAELGDEHVDLVHRCLDVPVGVLEADASEVLLLFGVAAQSRAELAQRCQHRQAAPDTPGLKGLVQQCREARVERRAHAEPSSRRRRIVC